MTLKELLSGKTLPVNVEHLETGFIFSVIAIGKVSALAEDVNGIECQIRALDEYKLYQEPRPKKKIYALIYRPVGELGVGTLLFSEKETFNFEKYYRAPWLDGEIES